MGTISTADFKNGVAIEISEGLFQITEFQHVKPGKGPAFVRTTLKNLRTGAVLDKTFRAGEKVEHAFIEKKDMQFLYADPTGLTFMDNETFEQLTVASDSIGDANNYLIDGMSTKLMMYGTELIGVDLPSSVELTVAETEPGLQGDRVSGARKPATLETGLVLQVPLFIEVGTKIKVDTRNGEYQTRVQCQQEACDMSSDTSRSEARSVALEFLYEAGVREASALALFGESSGEDEFVMSLLQSVEINQGKALQLIEETLVDGWALDRLPVIDAEILKLGVAELIDGDVPEGVVLSEAAKLASSYSTESSAQFVNGVLAGVAEKLTSQVYPL